MRAASYHRIAVSFAVLLLPLASCARNTIAFAKQHHRYATTTTVTTTDTPPCPLLPSFSRVHETSTSRTAAAFTNTCRSTQTKTLTATAASASAAAASTNTDTDNDNPTPAPPSPRTAPKEVTKIFDGFAESFETVLDDLNYTTPQRVALEVSKRIERARGGTPYGSAMDAGCGTGLMGLYLRSSVDGPLVGIDLSSKMAELAAELVVDDGGGIDGSPAAAAANQTTVAPVKRPRRCTETARRALHIDRIYDGIFLADLLDISTTASPLDGDYGHSVTAYPKPQQPCFDLIASADVLVYFGAMDVILRRLADHLKPGGDLVFSTETWDVGDFNWIMLESERYAHDAEYVARMAVDAGLEVVRQEAFSPRLELGKEVLGTLHVFHKPLV